MAGKLLKENILSECTVGQGGAQTAAETTVMLTGGDRNVTLVCVRAQPVITASEVQAGSVAVQGTVEFNALYLTQEGELRSRSAQAGFTAVVSVENASAKMRARVMTTVSGVNGAEQDGRLELTADLQLEAMVTESANRAVARDVQTETPMALKTASLALLNPAARGQVRETVAENFALDDEAFTRVVLYEERATVDNVQAGDGAVEVTGSVTVDSLLAGADASAPMGWQSETIPFSLEVVNDDFTSDMQVSVTARVRDLLSEVVFNVDDEEEEGNLHIEYVLELTAEGVSVENVQVLADAYPLSDEPFRTTTTRISYLQALQEIEQTENVTVVLELSDDAPPIQSIVGAFAAPIALDTMGDDSARAEGLLRVTLLYRTAEREGAVAYEQEVPFAVDFDRIPGIVQVARVEIGDVEAERMSPTQAQVRVEVEMEAANALAAEAQVLDDIAFEGEPVSLPVGAVLYYPEAQETLWDVARRYRISEEALRARNPEEKAPLLIYRRLTEF